MISVVVPVLIRKESHVEMTLKCLDSKNKTNLNHETVIVETESDYFRDYADIHVYERSRTTATKSINRGFKVASGDFVVLLTNDVVLKSGWLECLMACFDKKDCGASTLATTQLYHIKQDLIEEGVWFSVAMVRKEDAWFDERYVNSWDDTDLVMRLYLEGKKMYRNYNCVVDHIVGGTHYEDESHKKNFERNQVAFKDKYKNHMSNRMYKILTEGTVI